MPTIRSDIVDVYMFRRPAAAAHDPAQIELLQLLRADGLAAGAWHPIMGHIQSGESAAACALREMFEETGLAVDSQHLLGLWALEQIHPYFVPQWDAITLSPRFCAEVSPSWQPVLSAEHTSSRWVKADDASRSFLWPGQLATISEIMDHLLRPGSPLLEALRLRI